MVMIGQKPNILLIIWDTTRAQNLSCYGYRRETTPYLDAFSKQSILFKKAISVSPWTLPSHASLFTGLYPSQHNINRPQRNFNGVQTPVLAECLQEEGYQTVGFSCNPWITSEFGFDRGFNQFINTYQPLAGGSDFLNLKRKINKMERREAAREVTQGLLNGNIFKNFINASYNAVIGRRVDKGAWLTNHHIRRWLNKIYNPDQSLFMFVNYLEPHLKYQPPKRFRNSFLSADIDISRIRAVNQDPYAYMVGAETMDEEDFTILKALYDAELRYLDYRFNELLNLLENQGILANSLVIISSDHGENIGEHGLMEHQYCLYDTLLHVPLLIRFPGKRNSSRQVHQIVETRNIFFTILDFLGIEDVIDPLNSSGSSLLSESVHNSTENIYLSEYLVPQPSVSELESRFPEGDCSQFDRLLRTIYSNDGYKFIWSSDDKHELYNLFEDPSEKQNLLPIRQKLTNDLNALISKNLPDISGLSQYDGENDWSVKDSSIYQRLKDLGYL
jgi:arylsulfatase A-like enzyme